MVTLVDQRLLLDITGSGTKGGNHKPGSVRAFVDNRATEIINLIATSAVEDIREIMVTNYKAGLEEVRGDIVTGIQGTYASEFGTLLAPKADHRYSRGSKAVGGKPWRMFNKQYYQQKVRAKHSPDKFWRKTGQLAAAFNAFSKSHKISVSNSKKSVSVEKKGAKGIGRPRKDGTGLFVHRMELNITLPRPKVGGEFFKTIFIDGFLGNPAIMKQEDALSSFDGNTPLARIAFMEGRSSGSEYRPFIAKHMARHGKVYQKELKALLKTLEKDYDTQGKV